MRFPRSQPLCAAMAVALSVPASAAIAATSNAAPRDATQSANPLTFAAEGDATTLDKIVVTGVRTDDYTADSTIGAKTPTSLRDIPQSVTVINRALLDAQAAHSFADALRNVPGITIGGAEGGQIGNNINLRGFTARTDVFLDGFRDRGQYYRDTFNIEQVEVLKGPSSMLFGRGSTGGVINQVSKKAMLRPLAEVSASIGTHDQYRLTADIDQPLSDSAAVRVNAFAQSIHSTRDVMSNKDAGIAPTLRLGIGTPTKITLSALLQRNDDMPDYGLPPVNGRPAEVDPDTFYGLTDDRTRQDVAVVSTRIEHAFSDNVTLNSQLQYSRYTTDALETAANNLVTTSGVALDRAIGNPTSAPLDRILVQLASHDRVIHDSSLGSQTDLIAKFKTGALAHTLIAGIELGRDTYRNQSYKRSGLPRVSLIDPVYLPMAPGVVSAPGNLAQGNATTFGAYANDTLRFNDHWQAIVGLRRDRYDATLENSTSAPARAEQTVYFTSKRAGVIYQPTETQSYYGSYGTSFNPSLEALTVTNNTQALPPESNNSVEIGGKWDLRDKSLSLSAALFQVEKTNARTKISATEYASSGNIRVRGAEVGISGHLTDAWQVFAGYTRLNALIFKASDGTQGLVPANTPRNSATVWNSVRISPQFEIGGGATYQSQRFAANNNTTSAGGFMRFDAMAAWHQPDWDLRVNLLNLSDKRYLEALIPSDGGRAVPAAGRTLLATIDYRF